MFTRFGLMALMITIAAGCDEEAKASTDAGGGAAYDDSEVLARLDALEAAVATMQEDIASNTEAIAAIDTSELESRITDAESSLDALAGGPDLTELSDQIAANQASIESIETGLADSVEAGSTLGDRVTTLEEAGYITSADLPDTSGFALSTDIPDVSAFLTATDLSTINEQVSTNTSAITANADAIDAITGTVDLSELDTRVTTVEAAYVSSDILETTVTSINEVLAALTDGVENNSIGITMNMNDIVGLVSSAAAKEEEFLELYTLAGENYTNIAYLQIEADLHDSEIDTNTASINALNTDISDAVTAVGENYTNIAYLQIEGDLQDTDIDTNTANIEALTTRVDENTLAVSGLDDTVATYSADIATNSADILVNTDAINANTTDISSNQTAIDENGSSITSNTAYIVTNIENISTNSGNIDANTAITVSNAASIATLSAEVDSIDTIPGLSDYVSVDDTANIVLFTGANVQLVSGSGATDGATNGLGNLVIGYNELYASDDPDVVHAGSHNLVVGDYNSYTSYAGFTHGAGNETSAPYAATIGGRDHRVYAESAVALGGEQHIIYSDAKHGVAVGGGYNEVRGMTSSIVGAFYSTAGGYGSTISGGGDHDASGTYATIFGGQENSSSGYASSVSGGQENAAFGDRSSISGGGQNTTGGDWSTVAGGYDNRADGDFSSVSGGIGIFCSSGTCF